MELKPIARMRSDFGSKFGIPRQAGLVDELYSTVVFRREYSDPQALRGLDEFSHIWLIWGFSQNIGKAWHPTVRPPRLGGNERKGVFASRSPLRPNNIGMSVVRLISIEQLEGFGPALKVAGADLLDNTPIYDIKPYIKYSDSIPDAVSGYAKAPGPTLEVRIPQALLELLPPDKVQALRGVLAQDPRPAYQDDPERGYAMEFAGFDISFSVVGNCLTVFDVKELL